MSRDSWYGLTFAALAAVAFISTFTLPKRLFDILGPRTFPQVVAGLLFALSVMLVARSLPALPGSRPRSGARQARDHEPTGQRHVMLSLVTLGATVAYLLLLGSLGYLWATALFLASCMWLLQSRTARSIPRVAVLSLLLSGGIYLTFTRVLSVMLP